MGYTNSGAVVRMAEFTETFQIYSYRTWVGGLTEGSTIFSKSKGRKSINKLQLFNNNPHEITMSCILVWEREVSSWKGDEGPEQRGCIDVCTAVLWTGSKVVR